MRQTALASAAITSMMLFTAMGAQGETLENIKYGDMNSWVTLTVNESSIIGGKHVTLYEIGPNVNVPTPNTPYTPMGGSPWGTSNVYAKVKGITKGSNAVYPSVRSGANKCAKLCSEIETLKVLGLINLDVMVSGSIFLGQMIEPVTSTSSPYSKMIMGVPYTKRPNALVFDYKVDMPANPVLIKASGFGGKKTLSGHDAAVVFVFLQRRWEDAQGNIHAMRVATGGKRFSQGTDWHNAFHMPLYYGDFSKNANYQSWLNLQSSTKKCYYTKNSKGKMVPVIEEGWDSPDAEPTHVVMMMSAGSGEAYVGTPGLTFYVDNVAFAF